MSDYRNIKEIAEIAKALGYRRKKYLLFPSYHVTLQGLNWSGGSRSEYTAVDLVTLSTRQPGRPHPMNNAAEGARVELPYGTALAKTGTFMGKPAMLYLYVRPDNMPVILEKETN